MTDTALKADTAIFFSNGRWIINLQGCLGISFDPQGIVNSHPPTNINWDNDGIQKLRAAKSDNSFDFRDNYYFNEIGGESYIDEHGRELNLCIAYDMSHDIAEKYGKDLHSLLGADFISVCHPAGHLVDDYLGVRAGLRFSAGGHFGVNAQGAGYDFAGGRYGLSLLFQVRSSHT